MAKLEAIARDDRGMDMKQSRSSSYLVQVGVLVAVYVATARLGLALDAIGDVATSVWPPTGIALAALFQFGLRLWPGVAAGAFLVNSLVGASPAAAAGMAVGNTLEAVVGALMLRRIDFRPTLDRLRDVLGLIVLAALGSTTISATIGTASGHLGGMISTADMGKAWWTWWLGDLMGDLIVAPLLFIWLQGKPPRPAWPQWIEAGLLAAGLVFASLIAFGNSLVPAITDQPYLVYPFLIWAAVRFGQPGGVTGTFGVAVIAVTATALQHGPFAGEPLHQGLWMLQAFLGVAAVTLLVLGAVVSERAWVARANARLNQALEAARRAAEARVADMARLYGAAQQEMADRQRAEEQLRAALAEKETLLKEVHHRVKNNLAVIDSLLVLQAEEVPRQLFAEALRDSRNRIRSMAAVHESLYRSSNLARIDFAAYARSLCQKLWRSYGVNPRQVDLRLELTPVELDLNLAIPLGLLTNELVSNSLKHAFADGRQGWIAIQLRQSAEGIVELVVQDNGVGLPPEEDLLPSSMGTELIHALTKQIDGTLQVARQDGTRVAIAFDPTRKGPEENVNGQGSSA